MIGDSPCNMIHSSLTVVNCFENDSVGKQPVAWKECCAEYCLKELQESMGMCTGRLDINEIPLKTALPVIQLVDQLINTLLNGKYLDGTIFKAFADNKFKIAIIMISVIDG